MYNWGFLLHVTALVFDLQEQQEQFPLQKVLKVAATEREFGNYLFRQNRFCDAKVRYKRVRMLWKFMIQKTLIFKNFCVDGCAICMYVCPLHACLVTTGPEEDI